METTVDIQKLQRTIDETLSNFQTHSDANRLIIDLRTALFSTIEDLIVSSIENLFSDPCFFKAVKKLAAKLGFRFKGFKPTSIRLLSGRSLPIESPYFAKALPKSRRGRKRKKRKPKSGIHLGLAYLGFMDRCSAVLASASVQASLLCPSFEIANRTLSSVGIDMDIKTIRRLCMHMGNRSMENRHRITLSENDHVTGRVLFVCIDGGRLRERRTKKGRLASHQKRRGYYSDWREPTQIVIQWLDAQANPIKEIAPLYDATMADINGAFELLEDYLRQIGVDQADGVIFCADGDRRYWKRFSSLAEKLEAKTCFQVIDYTHAKQNLHIVADHLPKTLEAKERTAILKNWKDLLWQGNLMEIRNQIRQYITYPSKLKKALNKFNNYFVKNLRRMQYAAFRLLNLPTGSGCVESAGYFLEA
ncbi:hypothetical protein DSCO28_43430 [Desulfosarcina ovata subsp. sediminis]|uniref:ISLre2 family transposase n=1 Tax=Desulfosarcina ovata subsp. sediminis TaxID=885957 RepID=A0A5K7ZU80_9BACT|nr:hypothetical protein [Desulfosarcina ovata]BBO83777.1 hypothetical protein DSCO28_43430 [Desulfosarcina ovata subsp. sediminis]